LALRRDRRTVSLVEPLWRPWALLIAVAFGAVITLVLLLALAVSFDPSLSQFFAERSVPEAYGRNVVNVILVDFRALDTLGEITVVMLSLVAALPLLQVLRKRARAGEHE
jgi:multicomponent Na+:H+ antiporter subunit A